MSLDVISDRLTTKKLLSIFIHENGETKEISILKLANMLVPNVLLSKLFLISLYFNPRKLNQLV
jgi:hypothetical protein